MRSAGLFMIVDNDKAVLLRARQSYNSGARVSSNNYFLEKISIPRGKRDGDDSFDYETAVREFIEETATVFDSALVYKNPFVLQWNDAGVVYKYAIYVGVLRGMLKSVSREPNSFCVKLRTAKNHNEYNVNIESRRFNNEIRRNLHITSLTDYFRYMTEAQLTTYASSNYSEFFDFVKNVKSQFDDGRLFDFFLITLKLNNWELFDKWNVRRPKIVSATRRELMNIVNV
ncbi:ac38-like protein [Orgyia leucostigma nucleopolyhedrovirus]|uniref:Ac38-like protein n=1 Tax=Orgyia leucostigma nucleopolyhedrovirus TaxID=490711 RepID=B0FDS2_9ABAC|nr:ac38-like protein [Orgyia leucostigma nucleopolyhedrovirus]ABY65780.1 ac38-like protein [Orgyia leucostigma nucleopolyhedrovirus]